MIILPFNGCEKRRYYYQLFKDLSYGKNWFPYLIMECIIDMSKKLKNR